MLLALLTYFYNIEMDDTDNIDNCEVTFDNLTILKEFSNIANLVRNEDFLETVPKSKIRRVKWLPMFNYLKQTIVEEMVRELSMMWDYEAMPEKFETLEKQKEKFSDMNQDNPMWRPQLGNVQAQLKAADVANLRKQKLLLQSLAKEYETRVERLKATVSAKRGYLKALQMDIQKYQKKNEDFKEQLNSKIVNHNKMVTMIMPNKIESNDIIWTSKDYEE